MTGGIGGAPGSPRMTLGTAGENSSIVKIELNCFVEGATLP